MLPLDATLPAILPVGRFLIRTPYLVVALSHVAVYPTGCMLCIQLFGKADSAGPQLHSAESFDRLVFAARFGEDVTAVLDGWHHLFRGAGPLQLSLLGSETGASTSRARSTRSLWLHPLPPPRAGTLSILAPDVGPQFDCPLDGRAIVDAASQAQLYRP